MASAKYESLPQQDDHTVDVDSDGVCPHAERVSRFEHAGFFNRLWIFHVQPLIRTAMSRIITIDDIDPISTRHAAARNEELLYTAWTERLAKIDRASYERAFQRVERLTRTKWKIPDPDEAWAPVWARIRAGEFTSSQHHHDFAEAVMEVVKRCYKEADPECPLCGLAAKVPQLSCPPAFGAPKMKGMPAISKKHVKISAVYQEIEAEIRSVYPNLLWLTIGVIYRKNVIKGAIYGTIQGCSVFANVFVLPRMSKAIVEVDGFQNEPIWKGYMYSGIVFFFMLVMAFFTCLQWMRCMVLAVDIRASLATNLHRKALKLSKKGWEASGGHGKIFNLLNSDTDMVFQMSLFLCGMMLFLPVQMLFAVAYLAYILLWPTAIGVVIMAVSFPFNYDLGNKLIGYFMGRMKFSDTRVKKQQEIIENIRGVKFFCWEEQAEKEIRELREKEISAVDGLFTGISKLMFSTALFPYIFQASILIVYALWRPDDFTNDKIFQSVTLAGIMRQSFAIVPMLYSQYLMMNGSFYRISDFLMKDEVAPTPDDPAGAPDDGRVECRDASFRWKPGSPTPALQHVNLVAGRGELVMVVGKVGAGKTALLEGLLREMTFEGGWVHVGGSVAFCPQQPWIFNATVKANVTWHRPCPEAVYQRLVDDVCLRKDLDSLPHGDMTEIGEKGINLSGGQKARVSLARAVRTGAQVYLLDDVLSAVDAHVGRSIFDDVIQGQLRGKTRVLVTNQLQYLEQADRVYVVSDHGSVEAADFRAAYEGLQSTPDEQKSVLQQLLSEFYSGQRQQLEGAGLCMCAVAGAVAACRAAQPDDFPRRGASSQWKRVSSSHRLSASHRASVRRLSAGRPRVGSRAGSGVRGSFSLRDLGGDLGAEAEVIVAEDGSGSPLRRRASSICSAILSSVHGGAGAEPDAPAETDPPKRDAAAKDLIAEEEVDEGFVSVRTYLGYMKYFGGAAWWTLVIFLYFMTNAMDRFSFIWLSWYADRGGEQSIGYFTGHFIRGRQTNGFWFGIYGAVLFVGSILLGLGTVMLFKAALGPCRLMTLDHQRAIFACPTEFFDVTPIGRIITRFTFDWMGLDWQVPASFMQVMVLFCTIGTSLALICISVPWFCCGLPVVIALYAWINTRNRASLQMRRLFNKTKSPVTDVFASTLHGLTTVRASARQEDIAAEQRAALDRNNAVFYAERFCFEWVRLRVNLLGALLVGGAYCMLCVMRGQMSSATVGLVISQCTAFVVLIGQAFVVLQQLALAMNSVERINAHLTLPPEETDAMRRRALQAPPQWPTRGDLVIRNLCVRYRAGLPLVLRDVNLRVEAGWRVGICGRTGGGKSTLLKAMFRLMHPDAETPAGPFAFLIDGVEAHRLSLKALRSALAIIPQEPVVFAGSIQKNVDPFGSVADPREVWAAVRACHLEPHIRRRTERDGKTVVYELTRSGDAPFALAVDGLKVTGGDDAALRWRRYDAEKGEYGESEAGGVVEKLKGQHLLEVGGTEVTSKDEVDAILLAASQRADPVTIRVGPDSPLDIPVTEDSLSVGQRQLLCLARALVLRRRVLLLDEATASVDVVTDAQIQRTLVTSFAGVTQLAVAHRLNTIVDCDRILVMAPPRLHEEGGRIAQFDTFRNLTTGAQRGGEFHRLAVEAGLVADDAEGPIVGGLQLGPDRPTGPGR